MRVLLILLLCSCTPIPSLIWPESPVVKLVIPPVVNQEFESKGVIWVGEWTKRVDVNLYLVHYEQGERQLYLVARMEYTDLKKGDMSNPLILVVFYIKGLPGGEYEVLVRASNRYRSSERRLRFTSVADPIVPRYNP